MLKRDRLAGDGRVVLLSLAAAGRGALEEFRSQVSAALRADMDAMSDRQVAALETATDVLGTLVDVLQQAPRAVRAATPGA